MTERGRNALRGAMVAALVVDVSLFVFVVARRIFFPHAIEWMTGSVLDHAERVRAGLPLYAEPNARWIPYIYPPLYSWIVAALGGSSLAGRLVSLVSTGVQAECVRRLSALLGASRFWSLVAVGLFFACFSYVGWWYDLERSDQLFGALMLVGALALLYATHGERGQRARALHGLAGALLGFGFFAKQQAVFFLVGATLALLVVWRRERSRAALLDAGVFVAGAATALVPLALFLNARSSGWFAYYVLRLPRAHGITWDIAIDTLPRDAGLGFLLVAGTLATAAITARGLRGATLDRGHVVFTGVLLAGLAAATSSRLHIGGWVNVLQPWSALACVAVAVLASRLDGRTVAVSALITAQLALWLFDPRRVVPAPGLERSMDRFGATIARLEQGGEVLLVARGHVTRQRHFQLSALADVVKAEGRSPSDLVEGLRTRRFAAIVDDARLDDEPRPTWWPPVMLEDFDDLRTPLFANYFVAARIDEEEARLPMHAPGMPRWVLLPRSLPLDAAAPDLRQRRLEELSLAEARARALGQGRAPSFSEADIEARAAESVDRSGARPAP